jgi:hypothetical protein
VKVSIKTRYSEEFLRDGCRLVDSGFSQEIEFDVRATYRGPADWFVSLYLGETMIERASGISFERALETLVLEFANL